MVNLERLSDLTKLCDQHHAGLVAVSKTKTADDILEVYRAGHNIFGENRAQELVNKYRELPKDIAWHMIGHLQRNKVKELVPFVRLIHSVDSLRLAREIDKQAEKLDKTIDVLLQVHIAKEPSKYGFSTGELCRHFEEGTLQSLPNVRICGLMGMATFTDDMQQVRTEFRLLRSFFEEVRDSFFADRPEFKEVSMGMSGDYAIALEEGSTMIRVGSLIFGER